MRIRSVPIVPVGPGPRSLVRRLRRPGMVGRVLLTSTMLGLTVALSTIGVIAHADQQETTKRLAIQRERNLQAIGVVIAPSAARAGIALTVASAAPEGSSSD